MVTKTALILGATGAIGRHVLRLALDNPAYGKVVAVTRRPLDNAHAKLEQRLVDFERLVTAGEKAELIRGDHVYACLGTTMRQAGSRDAFRRIDHDYNVTLARLARANGAEACLLVSAIGAKAASSNFYLRVKGEIEEALATQGWPKLAIFQPSILDNRGDFRPGEGLALTAANMIAPLMAGPLSPYRPIAVERVAGAMIHAALHGPAGLSRHRWADMVAVA